MSELVPGLNQVYDAFSVIVALQLSEGLREGSVCTGSKKLNTKWLSLSEKTPALLAALATGCQTPLRLGRRR